MKNNVLANNLRKLRVNKNYTQEQVAEMLGVSFRAVSRWECGNTLPDVLLLPEIAQIFEVTIDDLYKEEITTYKNYAQRLLAVYECTGESEDFIKAEREFQKLLESETYTPDDLRTFGILYHYMMKDCQKQALKYFDKVICECRQADEENYYKTCRQKIMLLAEIGKNEENISIQLKALEGEEENPRQWLLLAEAYTCASEHEKAYELLVKAIKKFPAHSMLYVLMGDICRKLKNYTEALIYLNKAWELDTTYLDSKYSIGFCYEEMGKYKEAYEIWIELVEIIDKRGMIYEREFPLFLAKKCLEKE